MQRKIYEFVAFVKDGAGEGCDLKIRRRGSLLSLNPVDRLPSFPYVQKIFLHSTLFTQKTLLSNLSSFIEFSNSALCRIRSHERQ